MEVLDYAMAVGWDNYVARSQENGVGVDLQCVRNPLRPLVAGARPVARAMKLVSCFPRRS